jgi:pyocin large subunit-like protein
VERASNGDLLIYSASANLFGVQRKDGAPRLLMKPPEGRSYWEAQKTRAGQPRRSSEAEAR